MSGAFPNDSEFVVRQVEPLFKTTRLKVVECFKAPDRWISHSEYIQSAQRNPKFMEMVKYVNAFNNDDKFNVWMATVNQKNPTAVDQQKSTTVNQAKSKTLNQQAVAREQVSPPRRLLIKTTTDIRPKSTEPIFESSNDSSDSSEISERAFDIPSPSRLCPVATTSHPSSQPSPEPESILCTKCSKQFNDLKMVFILIISLLSLIAHSF